jgi:hypothetical protein
MPFSNYTDLQASIIDWMARNSVSGKVTDFIALGEAGLNRELKQVGVTTSLTGVSGQDYLDISSLPLIEPRALFVTDNGYEYELPMHATGTYTKHEFSGLPTIWAIEGNNILFDRELDQNYPLRFVYTGRFALSDAAPTNDFLTENPDLYMAAAIVWGSVYVKSPTDISMWKSMLDEFVASVKNIEARKLRGNLTVDPMFRATRRSWPLRNFLP